MTLKEALESGKMFKRKGQDYFYPSCGVGVHWPAESITATDWEIAADKQEPFEAWAVVTDSNDFASFHFTKKLATEKLHIENTVSPSWSWRLAKLREVIE